MEDASDLPGEPVNSAPPVEAGQIEPPQTKWPTVIGVIGIVFSSLGLFCSCAGFLAVPLQRMGVEMQRSAGRADPFAEAQLAVAGQFQIPMIVLIVIGLIPAIWLLCASIMLVRRQQRARVHFIGWALVSLLMLALNIGLQILMAQAMLVELEKAGESQLAGRLWLTLGIQAILTLLFGLATQGFVLLWFSRRKIKQEVAQWR
jgi:hypothetical protein